MKLHAVKFGAAMGIVYGLVFFCIGIVGAVTGAGVELFRLMGSLYVGTGPSILGAIIGAVWGFAVGFAFFGIAAWIYNTLVDRQ